MSFILPLRPSVIWLNAAALPFQISCQLESRNVAN